MNQNMHNWIATTLVILTLQVIFPIHRHYNLEDEHEFIVFVIHFVSPIIYLGVWLYLIS